MTPAVRACRQWRRRGVCVTARTSPPAPRLASASRAAPSRSLMAARGVAAPEEQLLSNRAPPRQHRACQHIPRRELTRPIPWHAESAEAPSRRRPRASARDGGQRRRPRARCCPPVAVSCPRARAHLLGASVIFVAQNFPSWVHFLQVLAILFLLHRCTQV